MTAEPGSSALHARFQIAFGVRPTHAVRAPGRVNLIGEHVDYNGLPVLPIAIERAVHVMLRVRDDARVQLANVDAAFAPRAFEIADAIPPYAPGDWGNYAKAAAQILRARFGIQRGFDAAVWSDIPPAAGLSSSSALVVACTLALVQANELDVPRETLAEIAATGERYVGTHSGGMDQAICLGARAGHAALIRFEPLSLEHLRVPADWRFVIAHSGVEAKKSGAAQAAYNTRVRECRDALATLSRHEGARSWPRTYRGLALRVSIDELADVARTALPDVLLRRFRHVVTENRRVLDARDALLAGDAKRFGELMNASHESLRSDYEVSCPELDALVGRMRERGALGARLTGAGFGGCVVALLVRAGRSDSRRIRAGPGAAVVRVTG
ncbi:MAG: galactokinase [Planctomycetota bacterium]